MRKPMVGRLTPLPPGDEGVKQTLRRMSEIAREYSKHPAIIRLARAIVHSCPVKDFACEARALFEWVRDNIRWTRDVYGVETLATPIRTLEMRAGDCLPAGTLLLTSAYELVPIAHIKVGDLIIGADGQVTCVIGKKYKGIKDLLAFELSNGGLFRCTPEHRLLVVKENEVTEVKAEEVKVGDELLSFDKLPFGSRHYNTDKVYIEGLYIADGWAEDRRFFISGRDGFPKEEQKRMVALICDRMKIPTRWHKRYIAVNCPEWAKELHACGVRAAEKRCRFLDWDRECAAALIRGLMADGGWSKSGAFVFSSTSYILAVQFRLLAKMFGVSAHLRCVKNHGGLGKNPVYRVTLRLKRKATDKVIVRNITEGGIDFVYDIETDSKTIYLPEYDIVVHNCDDLSTLLASLYLAVGFPVRYVVIANLPQHPESFSHVFVQVDITGEGDWVSADPSQPNASFGWEAPVQYRRMEWAVV